MSPGIANFRGCQKSGDSWAGRPSNAAPRRSAQLVNFRAPFPPDTVSKTRDVSGRKRAAGILQALPYEFPRRSRNPDFRISPRTSPEIADFGVGPKSGDLWAGRLSNTDPRRSAQLVDFRTPFSPGTPCKTRDGDVGKRAAGI